MAIIDLLKRLQCRNLRECHPIIEENHELGRAYLLGLAVLALADQDLHQEEARYFHEMARALKIPEEEAVILLHAAKNPSESTLQEIPDRLGNTKYRFYFIIDLQIMALQDQRVHPVEQKVIEHFGFLFHILDEDLAFLVQLGNAVVNRDRTARDLWVQNFRQKMRFLNNLGPDELAHYIDESNYSPE